MITWEWVRRYPPLEPAAVIGRGTVRERLADRVAADPDPARLRVVQSSEWFVVLGESADLPWVAGAGYLGWEHGILLPTTHRPEVPVELLAPALRRRHRAELIVLLPDAVLTSTMPSHPVDVNRLRGRP